MTHHPTGARVAFQMPRTLEEARIRLRNLRDKISGVDALLATTTKADRIFRPQYVKAKTDLVAEIRALKDYCHDQERDTYTRERRQLVERTRQLAERARSAIYTLSQGIEALPEDEQAEVEATLRRLTEFIKTPGALLVSGLEEGVA